MATALGFETDEERLAREKGMQAAPLVAPAPLAGPRQQQQPSVVQQQPGVLDTLIQSKGLNQATDVLFGKSTLAEGGKALSGAASAATTAAETGTLAGLGTAMSAAAPWLALGYFGAKKLKLFSEGTDNVQGDNMNKFNPSNPYGYAMGGTVKAPLQQQQSFRPQPGQMVSLPNVRPPSRQQINQQGYASGGMVAPLGYATGGIVGGTFPPDIQQALLDQGGGTILKDGVWYQADVTPYDEQGNGGVLQGFYAYKDTDNKVGGQVSIYNTDGTYEQNVQQQKVPSFVQGLGEAIAAAAPVMLPFVAPGLALSIGQAMGLSGTAAAAAGGAVISGAGTAVGGGDLGDVLKSAIKGGISGGLSESIKGTETFKDLMVNSNTADLNPATNGINADIQYNLDNAPVGSGASLPDTTTWTGSGNAFDNANVDIQGEPRTYASQQTGGDTWTGSGNAFDNANADVHTDELGRVRSDTILDQLNRGVDIDTATRVADSLTNTQGDYTSRTLQGGVGTNLPYTESAPTVTGEKSAVDKLTDLAKQAGSSVVDFAKANPLLAAGLGVAVVAPAVSRLFGSGGNNSTQSSVSTTPWVPGLKPLSGTGNGTTITMAPRTAINAQLGNSLGTGNGVWYNPLGLNLQGVQQQTATPAPVNMVAPLASAPVNMVAPLASAPVNIAAPTGVVVANSGGFIDNGVDGFTDYDADIQYAGYARGGFMNPAMRNPKQYPLMPNNPDYVNGTTGSTQVRQGGNPRYQKQGFAIGSTTVAPLAGVPQPPSLTQNVGSHGGLIGRLGVPNVMTRIKKRGGSK